MERVPLSGAPACFRTLRAKLWLCHSDARPRGQATKRDQILHHGVIFARSAVILDRIFTPIHCNHDVITRVSLW